MKKVYNINPLVNPVSCGDLILCSNDKVLTVKQPSLTFEIWDGEHLLRRDIDSQVQLCSELWEISNSY